MVYEAAKLQFNRHRHSSVPIPEHRTLRHFTDWLSMGLEIGFMARTEAAKNLEDWSLLAQNMNETRIVRRTLKLDLEKRFDDHATLPTGAQITKRPRESFPRVNELRDSINLEGLSQGKAEYSGKLARVNKQTTSPGSPGKDSRQSVTASMSPNLFWAPLVANPSSIRCPTRRVMRVFRQPRL